MIKPTLIYKKNSTLLSFDNDEMNINNHYQYNKDEE